MLVLNTRSRGQQSELSELLKERGLQVFELPVLEVELCADKAALLDSLSKASNVTVVVFTSGNAVKAIAPYKEIISALNRFRIAVVGTQTEKRLSEIGLYSIFKPEQENGQSLAKLLLLEGVREICFLSGDFEESDLRSTFEKAGGTVNQIPVYSTVVSPRLHEEISQSHEALRAVGAAVFLSGKSFREIYSVLTDELKTLYRSVPMVVNSRRLASTLIEAGFLKVFVSDKPSSQSIADKVAQLTSDSA